LRKLVTSEHKSQFKRVWNSLNSLHKHHDLVFDFDKETYATNLGVIWDNYSGKNMSEKVYQGCLNMTLTHYAETKLDNLPEGSVGYVLGRRKCFVKHINHVFKEKGLVWEKEDASKADFFIVGDILTKQDSDLNAGLKKPIVMDITIENEWHHNHSGIVYLTTVNESIITSLARKGERKDMDMLSMMLRFIHADALSNKARTRLVLQYLKCVGPGYSYSDKKHRDLIRLMRRITLPQHQFLLEPKFSNSYNRVVYNISGDSSTTKKGNQTFGYLGCKYYSSRIFIIPVEEDTLDLIFDDKKDNLQLESELPDFKTLKANKSTRTNYMYQGREVKAQISISYLSARISANIVYFSPIDSSIPCTILHSDGEVPTRGAYDNISYSRYYKGSIESGEILDLLKKPMKNNMYNHKNLENSEWGIEHFKPIEEYLINKLKTFCGINYGKRSLKLLD
jgi:hypothetical protein